MVDTVLSSVTRRLDGDEITFYLAGYEDYLSLATPVERNGSPISTSVLDDLMNTFDALRRKEEWAADPTLSDRWLACRVHWALRLSRAEAADRGLWQWLALRYDEYVTWRWGSDGRAVQPDRRWGPVHKQAVARLWWGAELFRNGPDYGPVERAFLKQDFINSYLHRPIVRNRSIALGLIDVLLPFKSGGAVTAERINGVARAINLITAATPPELITGHQQDDHAAFRKWWASEPSVPDDWSAVLRGPDAVDTTGDSVRGGKVLARRSVQML
jgi:hypothetical protein